MFYHCFRHTYSQLEHVCILWAYVGIRKCANSTHKRLPVGLSRSCWELKELTMKLHTDKINFRGFVNVIIILNFRMETHSTKVWMTGTSLLLVSQPNLKIIENSLQSEDTTCFSFNTDFMFDKLLQLYKSL